MSVECGVIIAFLTKRFLLLDGNVSPPANIVSYDGRVDNSDPSRVTDLIDIPVPWAEPDEEAVSQLQSQELTQYSFWDTVFYVPGSVDITSADAQDFARNREHWICEDEQLAQVPLLRLSEQPVPPGQERGRRNLSFYSCLFYLDDEHRRAVYQLLARMQAQQPYAELARKVAADLGDFNATHLRRGDFKVTYGVTALDRQPWEAIDAMDRHFSRDQCLLICTDERDDPFFDEIKSAWSDHVFIDHHILDNYSREFAALPKNDSLALAYLSQLVAAESMDFIGTMTSTYTAMIQRLRGNRGKEELFKFLWNELPEPGDRLERGRHPISDCVPLEDGVMVPEFEGAYSWSRYSRQINLAWMREWPESFLTGQSLETGSLKNAISKPVGIAPGQLRGKEKEAVMVSFEGVHARICSTVPGLATKLSNRFCSAGPESSGGVFTEVEVEGRKGHYRLRAGGERVATFSDESLLAGAIVNQLFPAFSTARKNRSWFDGMVLEKAGRVVLYVGDWRAGEEGVTMADALCSDGWELLGDELVPVRASSCEIVPFARCAWPRGAATRVEGNISRLDAVVFSTRRLHNRGSVIALSPSAAVAELAGTSRDFGLQRKEAIERICKIVEQVPVFQLSFSRAEEVPGAVTFLAELQRADEPEQAGVQA
jgi:hypothetical protein